MKQPASLQALVLFITPQELFSRLSRLRMSTIGLVGGRKSVLIDEKQLVFSVRNVDQVIFLSVLIHICRIRGLAVEIGRN
ncbi:hypothetical protein DWW78_02740 [Alistipes indistinctus]|nr:hypothetical protein [Alistipes indistinctus]RGU38364.1 hypothetical protein DWW78_02740 [Alistipes indistinctus]